MNATYRTPQQIIDSGYQPVCIPGPESLMWHDCIGHDHLPGEALAPDFASDVAKALDAGRAEPI